MFPGLSVDDALDGAYSEPIGGGYLSLSIAALRSSSDDAHICCGQFGCADPLSASKPVRKSARGVLVARQQTPLERSISDVIALGAKPKMSRITAQRVVTNMEHTKGIRFQFSHFWKNLAGCQLVGDTVGSPELSIPLDAPMAIVVASRSDEWPTGVRLADRDTLPKVFWRHGATISYANAE
jgi:hypothetical protein